MKGGGFICELNILAKNWKILKLIQEASSQDLWRIVYVLQFTK